MHAFLLTATRVLLAAFLLGGCVVVAGQSFALATGDRGLMEMFGTSVTDAVCVVAGGAGLCSFLLLYTPEGRRTDAPDDQR
ncbi:hypothetical protein [Streptomyces iconiensis]|uniref:Uncharacterized protein n=1 Tax=Streptomyces iconiensis TaxID=1384038 RepID=A0ABT7A0K2_9ACTN|nr:hypothetical protein [Streptomyces iconiensis]MDJ1134849.1 hypothetical protein [Streptomyces iconiensis]